MKLCLKQNSKKKTWAYDSCSVITEGPMFADCREMVTDYKTYYETCVYDACTYVFRLRFLRNSSE